MKKPLYLLFLATAILLSGKTCHASASENREPTLNLEKIIVTPSRFGETYKSSCANVGVVEESDIEASDAADITQVLNTVPSVNVLSYGSAGAQKSIQIRGANNSQVVTLINGRPVNTPRDGTADYNQIPLNNIERIEVLKGPASSIYGANAVGGVVNIITKSGTEKMYTEIGSRTGSFLTQELEFANGWKIGKFDYFFATNYIQSEGARINSDYKSNNNNIKLGYDINKENRITFETGYESSKTGAPYKNSEEHPRDRQNQRGHDFDLTWQGSVWEDSNAVLKVYQNTDRMEFIENPAQAYLKYAHQTGVYGADLQLSQIWFDIFRTTVGLDGQENKLDSSTSGKHAYNFKAAYGETELNMKDLVANRGWALSMFKDLVIKSGARIDDYSTFGSRTSPSASFSWWLFDKIKAHGLVAKSFRTPTFNDLYWPRQDYDVLYGPGSGGVEGNPQLKPEIATSREIGIGTFLFGSIETDVTYFYTKTKDMIAWAMDDTFWWRPTNINTAIVKGVETSFRLQPSKDLKLGLTYDRLSATDAVTHKWLIYRPRHQYKGSIDYTINEKLTCYLTGRYLTKRYTTETNSRFLKGYFVMNTNFSYRLNRSADITLAVSNVLDRSYQEQEDYPMPGTSFLVGTKLKF